MDLLSTTGLGPQPGILQAVKSPLCHRESVEKIKPEPEAKHQQDNPGSEREHTLSPGVLQAIGKKRSELYQQAKPEHRENRRPHTKQEFVGGAYEFSGISPDKNEGVQVSMGVKDAAEKSLQRYLGGA